MACPCCGQQFCCFGGQPSNVTVQFYAPVVVDSNTPSYDPVSPLLGTYVLSRDTVAEAFLGLNGSSGAAYGLYPAGKTWQGGAGIASSQWPSVPVGDKYILITLSCSGTTVSVSGMGLIAKAISDTTVLIFGVPNQVSYRTSFTYNAVSLSTPCGTSATSAESTQIWNHVEIYFRNGSFTGTSGAYFDGSKVKVSINF
jgi:hypothetical protein